MSTFDALLADLTRDVHRAQPKDVLQFSANWFQARLEEQRARIRDVLSQRLHAFSRDLPAELFIDAPLGSSSSPTSVSPFSQPTAQQRASLPTLRGPSPFGTLNVPGNALLSDTHFPPGPPVVKVDGNDISPTSPLTTTNPAPFSYQNGVSGSLNPGDYLHPPTSAILARRTSVSAESICLDGSENFPMLVYPKTPEQLRRIKASIVNNFIFRDLAEDQETGVLNAMQEKKTEKDEVVVKQGAEGDHFYIVESGLLHCYIRPEPPQHIGANSVKPEEKFTAPGYHPVYGKKVAECKPGSYFGELALMYNHLRAATVVSIEPSTLWSLDRETFRSIVLRSAYKRRAMYEQFLSTVTLLSSLKPEERSKIADALTSSVYMDGEAVVREGEMGETFFFIEEGEAIVTKRQQGEDGQPREIKVGHLRKGDYFGELSLLRLSPRAATVSAIQRDDASMPKLKVAQLDAHAFTRLLGPLRELMERRAGERYGPGPRLSISH